MRTSAWKSPAVMPWFAGGPSPPGAMMSAAVIVPVTVPPPAGQAGTVIPAGVPTLLHRNTKTPPFTPRWAKWMCDTSTGLDRFENVSVYVALLPCTVIWNVPVPLVRLGGTSLKPDKLVAKVVAPSSAVATVAVSPMAARTASSRIAQARVIQDLPFRCDATWADPPVADPRQWCAPAPLGRQAQMVPAVPSLVKY